MKAKSFLTLLSLCILFLMPLSLCAQESVCGKCYKKKSLCPYHCNHPQCKTCDKFCGARVDPCPYGGKHPKCSVCGKLKENCAYDGNHPKCTACGQLKENCTYRGSHPQCTTCGKLCGASSNPCPYDGKHPKCTACGQLKENCTYRGNHPQCPTCGKLCGASSNACPYDGSHPQCTTCGKLCGASSNACPYDGKHPKPSIVYEGRNKVYTINGVQFKMIAVEGGTFIMGGTPEQQVSDKLDEESEKWYNKLNKRWEKPKHKVTLSDYYIGETEVTQELWTVVMGSNPSGFTGNMQRPVEKVSWDDCQTFIWKLNELTGANFRLPTEAEWEFAARGGRNFRGHQYSGSSNLGDVAWYLDNASQSTHPVKTKLPNELGIYDLSGNVYEWCQDWFGIYSSSSQTNPTGPNTGSERVIRGGCWHSSARYCRSALRENASSYYLSNSLGLRLAY